MNKFKVLYYLASYCVLFLTHSDGCYKPERKQLFSARTHAYFFPVVLNQIRITVKHEAIFALVPFFFL